MRISEKLNLGVSQYELDFIDADLEADSKLYIDPFLIANSNSHWAIEADTTIKNFFNKFKMAMKEHDYRRGREMFLFMSEPKENCLGMSKTGTTNGRGVGELNAQQIVDKIIESDAIENGLVNNIEDLIIFVDNLDKDKLSDMVTNIIRKHLIDYTRNQCELWNINLTDEETLPYWDALKGEWVISRERLLVIEEREILLIPKAILSPINIYELSKYRSNFIVEKERTFHLQRQSALVKYKKLKNGQEKFYLPKKDVDKYIGQTIKEEYTNTKDYVRTYTQQHPDLYQNFIFTSKQKINSLTSKEIQKRIKNISVEEIIEGLIKRLESIPAGKEDATIYHHYIKSLLEILFYPYLINPKIEQEIHEGRKRIDIVMENNAKGGFFFKLHDINKIFCPYIYIECKNYGKDVSNPEIDQLSGRFSPFRGRFGILLCRDIKNEDGFKKRCQDTYKDDRGLIIYLLDKDIKYMLESIRDDEPENIDRLLEKKKREIVL